jgi:hypothetical protein
MPVRTYVLPVNVRLPSCIPPAARETALSLTTVATAEFEPLNESSSLATQVLRRKEQRILECQFRGVFVTHLSWRGCAELGGDNRDLCVPTTCGTQQPGA